MADPLKMKEDGNGDAALESRPQSVESDFYGKPSSSRNGDLEERLSQSSVSSGGSVTKSHWDQQAARFSRHDFEQSWAFLQNSINAYDHHLLPYVHYAKTNPACSYTISYATINVPVLHFKPTQRQSPIRNQAYNFAIYPDAARYMPPPPLSVKRQPLAAIDANSIRQLSPSKANSKPQLEVASVKLDQPKVSDTYAGRSSAKQPNETVDDFLKRLPPFGDNGIEDWLWVANTQSKDDDFDDTKITPDIEQLIQAGQAMLDSFEPIKVRGKAQQIDELKHELLDLASELKVTNGKWMLFVTEQHGESVWRKVCESVVSNKLGSGAKIAAQGAPGATRLICIYTKDFDDTDDVKRILFHLRDMEVLPANKRIFYKPDVFTYLKIYSGNSWGIAPSLYSSADIFSAEDLKTKKNAKYNKRRNQEYEETGYKRTKTEV